MAEDLLRKELRGIINYQSPLKTPSWIHRYYRKLVLFCHHKRKSIKKSNEDVYVDQDCIVIDKQTLFTPFVTSYTLRTLKPFILIDRETEPPRVKLLKEICQRQNRKYKRHPIMYKYLQKHHVKAINKLCDTHFWSGIDISEALEFPEFSVVVEYHRIVVAFGFLVPDVSHTDAYISFIFTRPGWRGAGIAKYMLYHLINWMNCKETIISRRKWEKVCPGFWHSLYLMLRSQTCRGKDITLHVSASNSSALLLYQQFSFKPEEFIQNFYDKFMPENSRECRHAFFLRLSK